MPGVSERSSSVTEEWVRTTKGLLDGLAKAYSFVGPRASKIATDLRELLATQVDKSEERLKLFQQIVSEWKEANKADKHLNTVVRNCQGILNKLGAVVEEEIADDDVDMTFEEKPTPKSP